jgi:hypothetical protein
MPRYHVLTVPLGLAALLAAATPAAAQQGTRTATLSASVNSLAKLSLSALTISFPDADPDTVPQVPASGGPITVTARGRTGPGAQVKLSVTAADDLRSGTQVIPASAVTWAATGNGFVNGALAAGVAQTVGVWGNSGQHTGTLTFRLANAWTYSAGQYSMTLSFTLSAP